MTYTDQIIQLARKRGVIQGRDLEARGIPRQYLHRLYTRGLLERVARGLYSLSGHDVTEHHTLVEAAGRVPHGVICLLSALRFHQITTQAPYEVWMAIENKARRPKTDRIPLRIVYMSGATYESGVEYHEIEGVGLRVFNAAKTVADCFKFRNRIGLDVAIEALRDYRRTPDFNVDDVWHYATICRVTKSIQPYLEAMV